MSNKVADSITLTLKNEGPFYLSEPNLMLVDYYKNIGIIFKIPVVYYKNKAYGIVNILKNRLYPLDNDIILDTLIKTANEWYASKNFEETYYG